MNALRYFPLIALLSLSPLRAQHAEISRGNQVEKPRAKTPKQDTALSTKPISIRPGAQAPDLGRYTWQRTLYREVDLTKPNNAPLAYPMRASERGQNLFARIFILLAEGRLKAYEYIDGEEQYDEAHILPFDALLSRFGLSYERIQDIPSEQVKAYYIKERNYFNQANARYGNEVLALCPILYDLGDYGEVRKPLFWLRYEDLKPFISEGLYVLSPENEAVRGTLVDYFDLSMYRGDIVKTQNPLGRTLAEDSRTPEELQAKREAIERELQRVQGSLSLPDSIVQRSQEQAQGAKNKGFRKMKAQTSKRQAPKSSRAPRRQALRSVRGLS